MSLTISAHAKINLSLDILGRRDDGYHEVSMVMQSIALSDQLSFANCDSLQLSCSHPSIPLDQRNDIIRAARLLQDFTKTKAGARITLEKNIPIAAGLAGGSSNGAASLAALNRLWGLGLTDDELQILAAQLGSDMPFCLQGGTAWATGRGEKVMALDPVPELHLVLMKPHFGVSTKAVYGRLRLDELPGPSTPGMLEAIRLKDRRAIVQRLSNHLQQVTFAMHPILAEQQRLALQLGAEQCFMSGSGPTLIAVVEDQDKASWLAQHLAAPQWWVYDTTSHPAGLTIATY